MVKKYAAPSSLPHDNVLSLFEDAEEDVWVGTQGGLLRLSPSAASTITTADGAPLSINTIYQDPRGTLFVTALNGRLLRFATQTLEPAPLPRELTGSAVPHRLPRQRWGTVDGYGRTRRR